MTTTTHADILSRLVMLLILIALALYGYTHAPDIASALSEHLTRAVNIQSTTTR